MFDRADLVFARLKAPLRFIGGLLLVWLAFEALVYRSGLYVQLAEPDSNTGSVVNALRQLEAQYQPGARHVLVLGDSRIGEGFSAALANQTQPSLRFINLAVPGSTPRTWSYLLRAVDRAGYEYDAVVLGTPYDPRSTTPSADWPLDPAHHAPLLDLRDALSYPRTFASGEMRERARHAVLFPALALRRDTRQMLSHPFERLHKVFDYRPAYLAALAQYAGRDEAMPALAFDADGHVADWLDATPAQRSLIENHIAELHATIAPQLTQANDAYLGTWLGDIADRAARRDARLILLPLARGPYRELLGPHAASLPAVDAVAGHANAIALPEDMFDELEQPQYFFDTLHANRAGRERLSIVVATRVHDALETTPR